MLLTYFSTLQVSYTAGSNFIVAVLLNRDFSQITNKMSQLQHRTLPPHIEGMQLKPETTLKQIHYLVKL